MIKLFEEFVNEGKNTYKTYKSFSSDKKAIEWMEVSDRNVLTYRGFEIYMDHDVDGSTFFYEYKKGKTTIKGHESAGDDLEIVTSNIDWEIEDNPKNKKLFKESVNEAYGPKEYSGFRDSTNALRWLQTNRSITHNGWIIKGDPKKDEIVFYAEDMPKETKGNVSPFDEDELEDLIDELSNQDQ